MTNGHRLPTFQSFVSLLLVFLLMAPMRVWAQAQTAPVAPQTAPAAPKTPAAEAPPIAINPQSGLKVFVLEGAGVSNFIPDRVSRQVVVEVRDRNDLPLEGASVLFELPASGPGGIFANGQRSRIVRTDLRGQAAMSFEILPEQGKFDISVTATAGTTTGKATISQSSSMIKLTDKDLEKKHRWYTSKKFIIITSLVVVGAAVGIVLATRGSSKSSSPTVVITPGSPTFGGPQ
jgi:hypothetical protein